MLVLGMRARATARVCLLVIEKAEDRRERLDVRHLELRDQCAQLAHL
jgi:hypothetical protein